MFGKKTKRIKELEAFIENQSIQYGMLLNDNDKLQNENTKLRLDNYGWRNEVERLQSQVQRVGLVRDSKGVFRAAK